MARANAQWKGIEGEEAFAIFHGPHTYISPSWYAEQNVVPTWNYVAVHAYGTFRVMSDEATLLQTLRDTVLNYEGDVQHQAGMPQPWSIGEPDEDFLQTLLHSIVGFEIEITRIEGKWKLSQNHTVERRTRVINELQGRGGEQSSAIAEMMKQTLDSRAQ